jgi:hypothetical protein
MDAEMTAAPPSAAPHLQQLDSPMVRAYGRTITFFFLPVTFAVLPFCSSDPRRSIYFFICLFSV